MRGWSGATGRHCSLYIRGRRVWARNGELRRWYYPDRCSALRRAGGIRWGPKARVADEIASCMEAVKSLRRNRPTRMLVLNSLTFLRTDLN